MQKSKKNEVWFHQVSLAESSIPIMSGALHAAIVTTWHGIVDLKVPYRLIGKETFDSLLEFISLYNLGSNHHCRGVVGTNRQQTMSEHDRDFSNRRIRSPRSAANKDRS